MILAVLFALLGLSSGQCYLEDANAECAVCWRTRYTVGEDVGETVMFACPDTISSAWVEILPEEMREGETYDVQWNVSTIGLEYDVVADGAVIHANIHSCLRNVGACTPFVSNTPGLSTHTEAMTGVIVDSTETFTTTVSLEAAATNPPTYQAYTIIAHTRFEINETGYELPTRYDIAIGLAREVHPALVTASSSSIVTAAVAGAIVLVALGALGWTVATGKVSIDKAMTKVIEGPFTAVIAMILGLGDVISFSITVAAMINAQSQTTADLIPYCVLVLGISWSISLFKFRNDFMSLWDRFVHNGAAAEEIVAQLAAHYTVMAQQAEAKSKTGTTLSRTETNKLKTEMTSEFKRSFSQNGGDQMQDAIKLARVVRSIKGLYFVLLTIPLEQLPLIFISIYLMVKTGEAVTISDTLTLFFSAMVFGSNLLRLIKFPLLTRDRDELIKKFGAIAPGSSVATARLVQVAPSDAVVPLNADNPSEKYAEGDLKTTDMA